MLLKAEGKRSYMPTTFDETMVEFGFKLERKKLVEQFKQDLETAEKLIATNQNVDLVCDRILSNYATMVGLNNPNSKVLPSVSNLLYRNIYKIAIHENERMKKCIHRSATRLLSDKS